MVIAQAVNPTLAVLGQIAAIIICIYIVIFAVIGLVFNIVLVFGLTWVSDKMTLLTALRSTIDSVNKTTEAAIQGRPSTVNENSVVSTIAQGPARVYALDKGVDKMSRRLISTLIEFRARTVQVQGVFKALVDQQG
ncbi:MAG: hypothetical protein JO125_10575 [Chloroflexi bacterium]|nr:hypothetical protein [Ktedonobacteraceae bacterium]MBV9021959.1 hypothetical protein [Ktedonobacteraceae bacterium]MBV9707838.1 hypothetical protein [Chloroflexota bacterium]